MDEKEKEELLEGGSNPEELNETPVDVSPDSPESNPSEPMQQDSAVENSAELETSLDTPSSEEAPNEIPSQPVEQMLTQSRVNELVGRARQEGRESALRELYERYGVGTDVELDEVFGRGQAYDGLNDEYSAVQSSYNDLRTENALLKSEVAPERYEDVKLILSGKGYDVTVENIAMLLPSHPEWKGVANPTIPTDINTPGQAGNIANTPNGVSPMSAPVSQIRQLSTDATPEPVDDEEKQVMKLYGL